MCGHMVGAKNDLSPTKSLLGQLPPLSRLLAPETGVRPVSHRGACASGTALSTHLFHRPPSSGPACEPALPSTHPHTRGLCLRPPPAAPARSTPAADPKSCVGTPRSGGGGAPWALGRWLRSCPASCPCPSVPGRSEGAGSGPWAGAALCERRDLGGGGVGVRSPTSRSGKGHPAPVCRVRDNEMPRVSRSTSAVASAPSSRSAWSDRAEGPGRRGARS